MLFRANILALVTAAALIPFTCFLLQPDGDIPSWVAPVYILLWIPYAVWQIRKGSLLVRWGAIAAAVALLTWGKCVLVIPLAAAAFLCGGLNFRRIHGNAWYRDPWIQCAYLAITSYLLVCTFTAEPVLCKEFSMLTTGIVILLFLLMLAAELWRNCNALNLTVAFCAAYPFLAVLKTEWAIPAAFGFLILLAAMFLIDGFRRSDLLLINLGQLQLYALLVAHFFSAGSILTRAAAFFATGVAFLVLNFYLSRHFRGRFLRLDIEVPRLKADEKSAPYGKYRYAVLGRDAEGFAVVTGLLEKPDPARDCVRIRYCGVRRNWKNGRQEDERYHDFNFLFSRYYLNEKLAPAAERLLGRSKAKLLVAIYPNGNYAVRDLLIDGIPVSEAAGKEKK